jgi:Flp pilus assembly pilin Flp
MERTKIIKHLKEQSGASLLEMGLVIAFVLLVAVTAVPTLRYKIEAYLWLASLVLSDNEIVLDDGSRYYTIWVPEGAFRTWSNIIPAGPWCYVKLFSDPKGLPPGTVLRSANIQECRNSPP